MLSSSMVTEALAGIELVGLNRPHVATSPVRLQLPTAVELPLTVTADPPDPSVVPVGKLIVIRSVPDRGPAVVSKLIL